MSCLAATEKIIVVAKGLTVDCCYTSGEHVFIKVPINPKFQEDDNIHDIILSRDSRTLALITTVSKRLIIYELAPLKEIKIFELPRSASKVRFTENNNNILVADKSGDVLIYDINNEDSGTKLLGHLSLLLDVLQTPDEKFIVSTDRDEKIRVSCYPNTYSIQTYCLGHKEFVNHVEILPTDNKHLISTSGDGTIKVWDYINGHICHTINTNIEVKDDQLKDTFVKQMDEDGVEVDTLPIVHFSTTKVDSTKSLIAVAVHSYNNILIFSIENSNNKFSHKLEDKVELKFFPAAVLFCKNDLFIYDDENSIVSCYKVINVKLNQEKSIEMFKDTIVDNVNKESNFNLIKVLYKRRFDNVQEYQERKRQRLVKSNKM